MALAIWKKYSIILSYSNVDDTYRSQNMSSSVVVTTYSSLNCSSGQFTGVGGAVATFGGSVGRYYMQKYNPSSWCDRIIGVAVSGSVATVTSYLQKIVSQNVKGSYMEDVTAEQGTYPTNGQSGSYWYVYQGLANTAPTISGNANEDLGNKNLPFTINYSVNDVDSANILNVVEKLNGSQINSLSNAPRNTDFTINITKKILDSLALNQKSTITISVTDGTATTYKTITFTRINSGPSITDSDKDLGQVAREGITEKYTCHDVEGNTFTIVEKVDDIELKNIAGVDETEYTIGIPQNIWFTIPNGVHTYTITVTDSLGAISTRIFTFTKKETVIESTGLTNIISTDIAATKILLTPNWLGKENADIILFQVCNNAYDDNPTWEDATSQTLLNKPYIFTNKVKTSIKWGIDIKFKISLKAGTMEGIEFYGLGGAFE